MTFRSTIPRLTGSGKLAVASLIVACVVAVWSLYDISLLPPKLTPRNVEYASVHTTIVLDTPTSIVLDLRQNVTSFEGLENRAILIGDLVATPPVLDYVGSAAHVAATSLEVTVPSTPTQALPIVAGGKTRKTTDILRYNNQYRLSIEANPTSPTLDIYSEAPTRSAALAMANAVVKGLQLYLRSVASTQRVPGRAQLHVTQVGPPEGGTVDPGAPVQLAALAFAFSFVLCFGGGTLVIRSRQRGGVARRIPQALLRPRHVQG